jgi:hypothetical protein
LGRDGGEVGEGRRRDEIEQGASRGVRIEEKDEGDRIGVGISIEAHVGLQGGTRIDAHENRQESLDVFCVFCRRLRFLDAVIRVKRFLHFDRLYQMEYICTHGTASTRLSMDGLMAYRN